MINLRKSVALAATGALAVLGLATSANAQTVAPGISTVKTTVKVVGPIPSGVTGYSVDVTCNNLAGAAGTVTLTVPFSISGGSFDIPFAFTAATNCTFRARSTGTANLNVASLKFNIGGTDRTFTTDTATTPTSYLSAAVAGGVTSTVTVSSFESIITFTYPSVIVKKTIVGDEATPAFDYKMTISCQYNDGTNIPNARTNGLATGFDGTFTLKKDASRTFGLTEFPGLVAGARCQVSEQDAGGGSTSYASTQSNNADGTLRKDLPGVITPVTTTTNGVSTTTNVFFSASTESNGQTINVINSFVGDLIVSKVVTGDPKTNIAVYEISVACDKGGPKETFLLKDRQSKVYTNIASGTNCLVTETRSDGAVASYADNSGDNTTDGRVTIKSTASGCIDKALSSFPDCRANVIVTNNYTVATTTTAAPATTAAAPATTAAPAVVAAPATPVVEEPTFTG
jgi:Domain of unknown function (DUF5979)